jgi:hypothetical protein
MSPILAPSAEELIQRGYGLPAAMARPEMVVQPLTLSLSPRARSEGSKYCLKNSAVINAAMSDRGGAT